MYGTSEDDTTINDKMIASSSSSSNSNRESFLNSRETRLTSICLIMFIAAMNTFTDVAFELDVYNQEIETDDKKDMRLKASATFFIWFASLLTIIVINLKLTNLKLTAPICIMFVLGGILQLATAASTASHFCVGQSEFGVNKENSYCFSGHFGAQMLFILFPMLICLDIIGNILNDIHIRLISYSFVSFITIAFFINARIHFNVHDDGEYYINLAIEVGWVISMICNIIVFMINMVSSIAKYDILSNESYRQYISIFCKLLAIAILTAISLASVGQCSETSGTGACFYSQFWLFLYINISIAYDMQF